MEGIIIIIVVMMTIIIVMMIFFITHTLLYLDFHKCVIFAPRRDGCRFCCAIVSKVSATNVNVASEARAVW